MSQPTSSPIPAFAWIVLALLGVTDLVRGVMHTFLLHYSAVNIAGLDLSRNGEDQLMLLGAFGISNFVTGAVFLVIALRARQIVPTILLLIPVCYVVGILGTRHYTTPQADFMGRYFMLVYLMVCLVTYVACLGCRMRQPEPKA